MSEIKTSEIKILTNEPRPVKTQSSIMCGIKIGLGIAIVQGAVALGSFAVLALFAYLAS